MTLEVVALITFSVGMVLGIVAVVAGVVAGALVARR